ncbi:hypothetical protein [Vibrio campbellii]|uniref:Uncharacterized protein n=1 Tax=Vibrio campbellii TaxID=680 RepID=A0ACC7R721_9VIBR
MNVLIVGSNFFGYSDKIIESMESDYGANVDFISHIPPGDYFWSFLSKKIPGFFCFYSFIYSVYLLLLLRLRNKKYDKCIIILGRIINSSFYNGLRKIQPNIEIVMYQWDSIKNYNTVESIVTMVDRFITFDKNDFHRLTLKHVDRKVKIIHLPLFYIDEYCYNGEAVDIDIAFLGALHTDRYSIYESFLKNSIFLNKNVKSKFFVKNFNNFKSYENKNSVKLDESIITFQSMSSLYISDIFKRAKFVIDVHNEYQSGLTMRTFEALASGAKLITTNDAIKGYPFYNESVVFVFDRNNIDFDGIKHFISSDNVVSREAISESVSAYKLREWVGSVLYGY